MGKRDRRRDEEAVADEPHPRRQRRHRAAAVERQHRQQVEQVEEEAHERERLEQLVAGEREEPERDQAAERAEHGARQAHARLGGGVLGHLLHRHERAHEGDEHRRGGLDALAPQLDHVAHLVHEQQQHEAHAELPAPDQRVGPDRHQHRRRGGEQLDLRQQEQERLGLGGELGDDQPDRGERAAGPLPERRPLRRLRLVGRRVVGGGFCACVHNLNCGSGERCALSFVGPHGDDRFRRGRSVGTVASRGCR